jgi:hypothetical protein
MMALIKTGEIKMTHALKSIQEQMDNIKIAKESTESIDRSLREIALMKKESQYRIILYKSFSGQVPYDTWVSLDVDRIIDRTAREMAEVQ